MLSLLASLVFVGDSIIAQWPNLPGTNAGIPSQTSEQILNRFDEVLDQHPDTIVILAGTNDTYFGKGDSTRHIEAMIQRAKGVKVILCELPPFEIGTNRDVRKYAAQARVERFNAQLQALAAKYRLPIARFYEPMRKSRMLNRELFGVDKLHPNAKGYAVMWRELASLVAVQKFDADQ